MAKIFGQLERAQLENLSSDPATGLYGRIYYHTGANTARLETSSGYLNILLAAAQQIVNADINVSAAIARSKLASGSNDHVVINSPAGVLSSEATLAKSRGGAGADMSSVTFPSTGTIATIAGVQAITNKDIDGGTASNTNRLTIPKDTTTNITALTRKQGTVLYDTTTNTVKYDNGSSLVEVGGSPAMAPGLTSNIGLTYSAGILTICGADGTALSATNPGFVVVPHVTLRTQMVRLKVTANRTIKDNASGSSDMVGVLWDTTAGRAWDNHRPIYICAANLDNTDSGVEFFLSGSPIQDTLIGGGDPNKLGYKGTPPVDVYGDDCVFLKSSTPAAYAGKPSVTIGGFAARKNASDDWTFFFQAGANNQGILPNPHVGTYFYLYPGHQGCAAGKYFFSAGTVPSWASISSLGQNAPIVYTLGIDGACELFFSTRDGGNATNGVGGNQLFVMLPYRTTDYPNSTPGKVPSGTYTASGAGTTSGILVAGLSNGSGLAGLYLPDGVTTLKDSNFSAVGDDFDLRFRYHAFHSYPNG